MRHPVTLRTAELRCKYGLQRVSSHSALPGRQRLTRYRNSTSSGGRRPLAMKDLSGTVAIVGAAESDEIGVTPNKSAMQHHAEAGLNALADAGLSLSDVDGLFAAGVTTLATAEYMGIRPRYTDGTSVGGSSFVIHVAHAVAALNAGYCDVALVTHGQTGRSARVRDAVGLDLAGPQFETPYGLIGPPINYAMACSRYMHLYGEERAREGMAEIAVA